jgi:hypothetical protein
MITFRRHWLTILEHFDTLKLLCSLNAIIGNLLSCLFLLGILDGNQLMGIVLHHHQILNLDVGILAELSSWEN